MGKAKTKRISGWQIALIIVLIIFLIGSAYDIVSKILTKRQKEESKQLKRNMAVEYLREKYDMEADSVDVLLDDTILGLAMAYVNYADKQFHVRICTEPDITYISDNYQYEEIKNAILDKIAGDLPDGYSYIFDLYYYPESSPVGQNTMFGGDEVFDGTNLDDVLKNHKGSITMMYADTEFNDCEIFDWLREHSIDAKFFSLDSQERLNAFINYQELLPRLVAFAPYISDICEISDEESTDANYIIKECDNFLYCCPGNAEANICGVSKNNIINKFSYHNEDEYVSNQLSKAYKANNSWNTVYVYYPLSEINDSSVRMAWCVYSGQSNDRGIYDYIVCEDYAIFMLDYSNPEFMLVEAVEEDL